MSDLLNILQNKEVPIDNQQIIDYLQGQLQDDAQHHLEENEQADALMQDAMEGLLMMNDTSKLQSLTSEINQQLQQKIRTQKKRPRNIFSLKDQGWIVMSVVIILVLIILAFLIIHKLRS